MRYKTIKRVSSPIIYGPVEHFLVNYVHLVQNSTTFSTVRCAIHDLPLFLPSILPLLGEEEKKKKKETKKKQGKKNKKFILVAFGSLPSLYLLYAIEMHNSHFLSFYSLFQNGVTYFNPTQSTAIIVLFW